MNLLIDIGNSRIKWAMTTAGQMMVGQPVLNEQANRDALIGLWKGVYRPRRVALSCVNSNQLLDLVQSVARALWLDIDIIVVKSQAQAFGVVNAYRQPEKLGVDRWLSLVAIWQKYRSPACIVDCGTAITVDFINGNGEHQGGLISPGLALMKRSLAQGTAALPLTEPLLTTPTASITPKNFTEGAIDSGTLAAAAGLVEHVMARQPAALRLFMTGGDAELIAGQLGIAAILEQDLVLKGLLCVLEGRT